MTINEDLLAVSKELTKLVKLTEKLVAVLGNFIVADYTTTCFPAASGRGILKYNKN